MLIAMNLVVIAALQFLLMRSVEASSAVFAATNTFSAISSHSADYLDRLPDAPLSDGHHSEYISASPPHQFEGAGDAYHKGLQNQMQNAQVSVQPSVSQKAACTLLHGILQTYEAGDEIFESELMDPKHRKTRTETTIGDDEIAGTVKVYRPVLFQRIRSLIGMTEPSYLQCLDFEKEGMCCLADSDSKSGQSFWISKNEKLVLKTIKQYECSNLQRMLDGYLNHLKECSGRSCISTVLGLYRVTLKNGSKRYFMASRNVYPVSTLSKVQPPVGSTDEKFDLQEKFKSNLGSRSQKHTKFDLKGSTVGRSAAHTSSVMKDLDLISSGVLFPLGEVRSTLLRVLERDVLFLRKHSLMDYSLLVAVEEQTQTHNQEADTSGLGRSSMDSRFSSRVSVMERDSGKLVILGGDDMVYHFGIIDFLQKYSFRKVLETWLKGCVCDARKISAVAPGFYAQRMLAFIAKYTQ